MLERHGAVVVFGAASALALLAGPTLGQTREDLPSQVSALVDEARERADIPAIAVAVVVDGDVVAEHASGFADREAGVPATRDTVFPAASVSKLFTAALVMQQVEKGRLDLDAPVNESLEPPLRIRDTSGVEAPATLRQLLSHTSGLPVAWSGIHFDPADAPMPMEEYLADRLRIIHPPGERVVYANDAFALAGLLAARAAGRDFETLAREALLGPLDMSSSSFNSTPLLRERLAAAYGTMGGGDDRTDHADVSAIAPAGGLLTTAGDLAQFARLVLAEGEVDGVRLLQPESVREMLRLQARNHPEVEEGFGLGFGVREGPGRRAAWWDGGLPGAASRLMVLPDDGVGVVLLSNLAGNGPVNVLSGSIVDLLLGAEPEPIARPDQAEIDQITGTYRPIDMLDPEIPFLHLLVNIEITHEGERLEMRMPIVGEEATLRPLGRGRFRVEGGLLHGATALVDGDHLYAHMIRGRRVASWETANAFIVYAGLVALAVASVPAITIWRWVRRRQRGKPGSGLTKGSS
jgi:CubicO group peptidase (beta-lactamase class C family)